MGLILFHHFRFRKSSIRFTFTFKKHLLDVIYISLLLKVCGKLKQHFEALL